MRTLVTGATGFVGRCLLKYLKRPVVLSRPGSQSRGGLSPFDLTVYDWSPTKEPPLVQAFDNVGVVIHLAGESLAQGRWTRARRKRIFDSRVKGTQHLVETLTRLPRPPRLLISASAVGYYGSCGDQLLNESSPPGNDFLADLCVAWEAATEPAREAGIRVVLPRIGVVLGSGGGALSKMLLPFKLGIGGRLGTGRQWMPWVYREDLVQLLLFAVKNENLTGPVNATSPEPVTNDQFTRALGSALHRPTLLPVPAFALRIALGQFADVLLASQRVVPEVAARSGFVFDHPTLGSALDAIFE